MTQLFASTDRRSWAVFSDGKAYRYALGRDWSGSFDVERRTMVIVGLNPSIAGVDDDQTIRKDVGFSKRHNCTRLLKFNLYGWIETISAKLGIATDPVGPWNDFTIREVLGGNSAHIVVAAWGDHPLATPERIKAVTALLPKPPFCFGTTKSGQPRHTSRIAYETPLIEWKGLQA